MGALREEETRLAVDDPRREGLGPKPLHRTGKYYMFVILFLITFTVALIILDLWLRKH